MIRIFGGTDQGKVRSTNQDAFAVSVVGEGCAYAVLCDGMGGENGGHIASSRAVQIISQALDRSLRQPAADLKAAMVSACSAANAVVHEMAAADESLRGMGTTVVAAAVRGDQLCVAHAGDSRAYLSTPDGGLERLTRDHSVVQLLMDSGEITEEEAASHPKRHYITRALGIEPELELEYLEREFPGGGRLLLCSDGLYNYAPPEEHLDLINTCASEQDVYLLIDEANKAGGPDNITAVILAK